jgi:anti-sigma factor RsiW
MTASGKYDEWALHAYVDGEVAGESCAEIEAHLRANPEDAARVEAWRRQGTALKAAYDGALAEPVPASLAATLRAAGTWRAHPFMAVAAALLLLIMGGLGGWFLGQDRAPFSPGIADQALAAHGVYASEIRHPVEVAASDRAHLQAWLSKRVGKPFGIPELAGEGYSLLGGRLLAVAEGPAAQLMYEDADKRRITVFVMAAAGAGEAALQVATRGDLVACYWRDGGLGFAVAGEMDRDHMMRLARVIYDQLEG